MGPGATAAVRRFERNDRVFRRRHDRRGTAGNYVKRRESSRLEPSASDDNLLVHAIMTVALLAAFAVLAMALLAGPPAPRGTTRDRHVHTQKHSVTQT